MLSPLQRSQTSLKLSMCPHLILSYWVASFLKDIFACFYLLISTEIIHLFYQQEFSVVIYNPKIILVNMLLVTDSHGLPDILCDIILSLGHVA